MPELKFEQKFQVAAACSGLIELDTFVRENNYN